MTTLCRGALVKLTLAIAMCLPLPAFPQTDDAAFDLLIRGIKAATISISGQQEGAAYGVTGRVQTTGLAALIKRLRYEGAVTGTVSKGRYRPSSYSESADTGRRQSDAVLDYADGVPTITSYSPVEDPQPGDVDPATMGGTVDPLTALFATVRRVDKGRECNLSLDMFDGRRASELRVGAPVIAGDTVTCDGAYIRVQGFTPKEMAKQTRFPFTLTYAAAPNDQLLVVEVVTETLYGKFTMKRR